MKKILLVIVVFSLVAGVSFMVSQQAKPPRPEEPAKVPAAAQAAPPKDKLEATLFFEPWQHDPERFQEGVKLVKASEPRYLEGLAIFEESIRNNASASDIDYDHYWALYCLAQLKKYPECFEHYSHLRRHFSGQVIGGASGALRIWDNKLDEIKALLLTHNSSEAQTIVEKMKEIDQQSTAWKRKLPGSD